jgi:Flp pilus assembly protein TadG
MRQARGDDGAAVVDFVLVGILLIALFLLVFQVGVFFHVRNVVAASAAEGARYGATADRTPTDGAARAQQAITEALGNRVSHAIRCAPAGVDGLVDVDGAPVVDIVCTGPVPIVFGPSPAIGISVHGHALEESR